MNYQFLRKIRRVFLCFLILASCFSLQVHGDTVADQNTFYYIFHLFQNDLGQLVADRDFQFSYEIIPGSFTQPPVGQFAYRGEIVDFAGTVSGNFKFDVRPGKISAIAPYSADGQKAVFYDLQNQPLLTIPVSESSSCNDNGICNADIGEDPQTCPRDCKQTLPTPASSATPVAPTAGGSSGIISGIVYTVIGLLLLGGAWWFFKRRRSATNMTLPPTLPTPPVPPAPNNPV